MAELLEVTASAFSPFLLTEASKSKLIKVDIVLPSNVRFVPVLIRRFVILKTNIV